LVSPLTKTDDPFSPQKTDGLAEIALKEVGEGIEVEQALVAVFVDDVRLAVIDLHAADDGVAANRPGIFCRALEGVLKHAGVGEVVGRSDAEAGTGVRIRSYRS